MPANLPQVFENYIRTRKPPFADLGSVARSGTLSSEEPSDLKSFEEAYNRASALSNSSVQKYREQNAAVLDRERNEVRQAHSGQQAPADSC